jgi:hypothetical protein
VAKRKYRALKRVPVSEAVMVHRIVRVESIDVGVEFLAGEFASDRDADCLPNGREQKFPILQDGMSAFRTRALAERRWRGMRKRAVQDGDAEVARGSFIAELELRPGADFYIEDLGENQGHLTIWGDPTKLAEAVRRIDPAGNAEEEGS